MLHKALWMRSTWYHIKNNAKSILVINNLKYPAQPITKLQGCITLVNTVTLNEWLHYGTSAQKGYSAKKCCQTLSTFVYKWKYNNNLRKCGLH